MIFFTKNGGIVCPQDFGSHENTLPLTITFLGRADSRVECFLDDCCKQKTTFYLDC